MNFAQKAMQPIADIRTDYKLKTLSEADVATNPIAQFGTWWQEAIDSHIDEVNAMTLATASQEGVPDARIVLLKGYNEKGFTFFTNYESAKGQQLAQNAQACLVFFWKELERQVRINGTVTKATAADSDTYFNSRPLESRIGAWSSPQSQVITAREAIEHNVANNATRFANEAITRPAFWGGYVVKPQIVEFWQGRPSRLHDRIRYTLQANDSWNIERLAP